MKNATSSPGSLSAILAATLFLAPVSHAIPLYYTFEGNVIYSAAESHPLGTAVSFTFLVDRELDGQYMDGAGNLTPASDYFESSDWYIDYFYASYLGGSALTADNPAATTKQSWFIGMDRHHNDDLFSALRGSNSDRSGFDLVDIWSTELHFRDWQVGQRVLGENFVSNGGAPNTSFSSALTLTSISETNPIEAVPEPSTLAFMGLGLLGMGAAFRKRRRR